MPFTDLPPLLADALQERGYAEPTAVQAAVLEKEAAGRDLVVSAQTGSGKTVAFGLAMAEELLTDGPPAGNRGAQRALVIAPTRELALQVSKELAWLYARAGARIATCVGGMNPQAERRALAAGATIVVGTPGRLRDHLERGALDLSALAAVVLDEADEMLDMGFRDDLEEILDATPDGRRTLLFSATMPRAIERLAARYQRDALRIDTMGSERGHGDIAYQAMATPPHEVENAVVNLLRFHDADTAMLFCATRDNVRRLHATLQERGFGVVALSGEHSQSERNQALQALRDRRASVCVATDVAARGIDLPSLSLVVHVEIPRDAETLQHRSGRTGRAGKKGTAVLVVPYPRRKRVESMLRHAKIEAEWIDPPSREAVLAKDGERLLEKLLAPVEPADETDAESRVARADAALARRLLDERTPEQIAAMLVQAHRAKLPEAEELTPNTKEAREASKKERHRPGFEDTLWFRMDVGRRQNADPRWILPLLCRRGHITRNEVGAIRIGPSETHFQIPRTIADKFADALVRTAGGEDPQDSIRIEPSPEAPREQARGNRKQGQRGGSKPFVKPRGAHGGGGKPRFPKKGGAPHSGRKDKGPRKG
ncbi:DEAD/DEAH box helicase [Alteriqipengyuania sp. WL0013]|uniref:DEAD/DEAH box helicase n=1 Tax=Alteriqipengyuania sp. WL0013 TaxID=3110773 RepID=UPI002BD97DEB|nr:DEAD/DEAH box helicase [Alteriqipengyuania sp. WL0013]MEB3416816.1 DEAD/DEAH box helicase [Alteriqipengyuania sp. WL0013]